MQPKLLVPSVEGKFSSPLSENVVAQRLSMCEDLVNQPAAYCARRQRTRPDWRCKDILRKTSSSMRSKGWGLSELKLARIRKSVAQRLEWPSVGDARNRGA